MNFVILPRFINDVIFSPGQAKHHCKPYGTDRVQFFEEGSHGCARGGDCDLGHFHQCTGDRASRRTPHSSR